MQRVTSLALKYHEYRPTPPAVIIDLTHQVLLHQIDEGNADRLIGIGLSQARVSIALDREIPDVESGLQQFRTECHRVLGREPVRWYWSCRLELGIKAWSLGTVSIACNALARLTKRATFDTMCAVRDAPIV